MIVDVHTHVWHGPEQWGEQIGAHLRRRFSVPGDSPDASVATHGELTSGVDAAFVLGFRSVMLGADVPSSVFQGYVRSSPHRLFGFAGVDPLEDGCLDGVDLAASQGMSGVVVSPSEQGFHPSHTRAMRLYEKCRALGLILVVHQGEDFVAGSILEHAQPFLLDAVAREFPDLRILLTHCGHPWTDQALTLIGKHRNVFTELSGVAARPRQLYHVLMHAHQLDVTDRIFLGSDFPRQTPKQAIGAVYSLNQLSMGTTVSGIPREKLRAIVEADVLAAMGIKVKDPGLGAQGSGTTPPLPVGYANP